MADSSPEHDPVTTAAAERILSARWGGAVRLGAPEALQERPTVMRLPVLHAPAGAPATVVLKRARPDEPYDPAAPGFPAPAWTLFNHWAGLEFVNRAAGDGALVPRFYGGDRAAGIMVMEAIDGSPIDTLILGADAAAAEAALLRLATLLGRMHAATIGKEAEYTALRDGLGPHPIDGEHYQFAWLGAAFDSTAGALGLTLSAAVRGDIARVIDAMRDPGPFRAFTHGDPCPDNVFDSAAGAKLIDFDLGGYGHALAEGVYGRIHFPTCWCVNRLPEPITERMEAAYRAALIPGCPEAADAALFGQAVTTACAFWLLDMCRWLPLADVLEQDDEWGIATLRQRYLLRAELLARITAEFGYLEALGETFGTVAAELGRRWAAEVEPLPLYPAFR